MKILIVEDEPKTGTYLERGLTEAGFVVDCARDGRDGLHLALTRSYDLVLLDVMLPGMDGWEILREIRRAGRQAPVMYLSARDQVGDRVKGLELGADDYLVKPFSFSELLARVRTLLRRGNAVAASEDIKVSDLALDSLRRQGEVLPRALIASQVWDMNFDSDTNVIDVAVRRLRAKVDDDFAVKLIHTVRGMGYVLQAPES
jgi:two-component system copper resistance phosphate regulon response regulator CusR